MTTNTIMQLFYVDRVFYLNRTVKRDFPVCKGWSLQDLRQRQNIEILNVGFGCGTIECVREPTHVEYSRIQNDVTVAEDNNTNEPVGDQMKEISGGVHEDDDIGKLY